MKRKGASGGNERPKEKKGKEKERNRKEKKGKEIKRKGMKKESSFIGKGKAKGKERKGKGKGRKGNGKGRKGNGKERKGKERKERNSKRKGKPKERKLRKVQTLLISCVTAIPLLLRRPTSDDTPCITADNACVLNHILNYTGCLRKKYGVADYRYFNLVPRNNGILSDIRNITFI